MPIRALFVYIALALCLSAAEPTPRESGSFDTGELLPQIAAGGAWSTDIQLMHAHDVDIPQAFTLEFFNSNGTPLQMPVVGQGMQSVVVGILQPRGSTVIRLAGGANTLTGYAVLDTTQFRGVVMNAVLTQQVAGRPDFQASVPGLDDFQTDIQFPFRNDGPYTTTLAFVSGAGQTVTAIARGENGAEMCRSTWTATDGQHAGILLTDRLSCTAGNRGVVQIVPQYWGGAIAFLFHDSGAFTTQLPYDICCRP